MHEHTFRFYIRQGDFELDVEGDRNFVESYVAAFLAGEAELQGKKAIRPTRVKKSRESKASGMVDRAALRDFVKGKKLGSDSKRYLAFSLFLKRQGIDQINSALVRECYDALDIPFKPASRQNIFLMKKSGKAAAGSGQGYITLTPKGEAEAEKLGMPGKPRKKRVAGKRSKK